MANYNKIYGDFKVFKLPLVPEQRIEYDAPTNNSWQNTPKAVIMMLDGECSLNFKGTIVENGLATPYEKTVNIPALTHFTDYRENKDWIAISKVVVTVPRTSIYLCVSLNNASDYSLEYNIIDCNQAIIPVGALFILTEECIIDGITYLKHEPYLNQSTELNLSSGSGKVIIVKKQ